MTKRSLFTNITPLPPGISREHALKFLHDHMQMIDLNPLVDSRHPCDAPEKATAEESHARWYRITDIINYGIYKGKTTYHACFHNLPDGLQTHTLAPAGLDLKGRWSVGGNMPGEMRQPVEHGLGIPQDGLYLREDVEMRCNMLLTSFVKKNLQKSHKDLVGALIAKAGGSTAGGDVHRSHTITTNRSPRDEQSPQEEPLASAVGDKNG